ncbi:MAG: hypothetical protein A3F67_04370 [Verrucomicrobia bacterium RIFCSPHIGHO2_12_FULL_41_10]|nr:MAG: hypothetical protein A3F67_04370 [Verrucomicrobia bacterium RIFCSPHIGHO2_12_FULL_41_10]HLB33957.1 hypothetical protein [Chthoniobacterales bacterium]
MISLKHLFFLIAFFNLITFAIATDSSLDTGISIFKSYEQSLSPDGKFEVVMINKGEDEVETYFINTETKKLIGAINSAPKDDITALWNNKVSKVVLLLQRGKVGSFLEIFILDSRGRFQQILFNLPKEIENNYKKLQKDSAILFRESTCGLGSWIDDNTVSLIADNSYEKRDKDINYFNHYLASFNVHITKEGKAVLQNIKVIGSLTDKEYDDFVAKHNYQF